MNNGYMIIIDRAKTKEKILFNLFDLSEMFIMCLSGFIGFKLSELFTNDLYSLVIGVGLVAVFGLMFIELPDHMNVWQHIVLMIKFYFRMPLAYMYYPELKKVKEVSVKNEEVVEKTIIKHRKKRKK